MIHGLIYLGAVLAYGVAATFFTLFLTRGSEWARSWAPRFLVLGLTAHIGSFAYLYREGDVALTDIRGVLLLLPMVLIVAFLVALRSERVAVLGAFIAPVAMMFMLGAAVGHGERGTGAFGSSMLPFHIAFNILGVGAFGLASAAAVAYILQERQLRQRKITGLFQRLPSLETLDTLSFRLVGIGFPLFSLGVITGATWSMRHGGLSQLTSAQLFGIAAWAVFGLTLVLRISIGWQGRRAAIATLTGFGLTAVVLLGYALNAGGVG